MVFDLDRPLSLVQSVLSSSSCSLNKLPDEEKFTELSKRLAEAIRDLPADYDTRKVFLFLVLNSDAVAIESIAEDENFCHLIGIVPPTSFVLTLRLIFKLGGLPFLLDLITYGPSTLSMSVIQTMYELIPQSFCGVELILDLSKACFRRLTLSTCEAAPVLEKIFDNLVSIQNLSYSSLPNDQPYPSMNEDLKKALHYINNMQLFTFTMENDVPSGQSKCWEGYLMRCASHSDLANVKNLKTRSADELIWEYRNEIIRNLNILTREFTVDNWMGMAEVTYGKDKTLQRTLGEKTFQFMELLEKVAYDTRLPDLPAYLEAAKQFAMKPEIEVEKNDDLSIEEIISNLSCTEKRNAKLIKAFLKCDNLFEDDGKLKVILDNSDLLDKFDVDFIIVNVIQKLEEGDVVSSKDDMLKSLFYQCMNSLPLQDLMEVKHDYFENYGMEKRFSGSQFTERLHAAFKELSFEPEEISVEWQCELVRLFIVDPTGTITKALRVGVDNLNFRGKIADSLYMLKPESQTIIDGWISWATDGSNDGFQLARHEMEIFPKFALELWRREVLDKEDFLRMHVISGICKSISAHEWDMLSMWISTMNVLISEILDTSGKVGSIAVLLVYVGQVLEFCQQSIEEFNGACMSIRSEALSIISNLKLTQLSEAEKDWFQSYITKYSGITLGHLEVFALDDHPMRNNVNFGLCFNAQVKTSEFAAFILVEMLPFLCTEEWCGVASALKRLFADHSDRAYSSFQSFQKSILLLVAACGNVDLNKEGPHRSCLDFCVRSLGSVLKFKILHRLNISNYLLVLEETLYLLCKLPSKIWNESGMHILPIVVDIMNKVPPHVDALNTLSAIIMTCPVNQCRELLEDKLKVVFKDVINEVSEVEMNDR